jgi:Calcineurin-like phosphoesterase
MSISADGRRTLSAPSSQWRLAVLGMTTYVVCSTSTLACETSTQLSATSDGALPAGAYAFVVLPDTQYYASDHPEILEAQTQWIIRERIANHLLLVVHEGDIVDKDDPRQWTHASRSLHELDRVVPYVLSSGNHDYQRSEQLVSRESMIDRYFPPATFEAMPSFGGTFEADHIENSFQVVEAPGGAWLILSLEFGPRDAALEWASRIAKQHASMPAIVVTHAYLYSDNTRYDHLTRPDQLWNPHVYLNDAVAGSVNDGEEIWRKLILGNDNIRFVLCGHDLEDGIGRLTSTRPDGSQVHQLLANYQMLPMGGGGFLRLMWFFPADGRVALRTYSPFLNTFKTDPDNQFELNY